MKPLLHPTVDWSRADINRIVAGSAVERCRNERRLDCVTCQLFSRFRDTNRQLVVSRLRIDQSKGSV